MLKRESLTFSKKKSEKYFQNRHMPPDMFLEICDSLPWKSPELPISMIPEYVELGLLLYNAPSIKSPMGTPYTISSSENPEISICAPISPTFSPPHTLGTPDCSPPRICRSVDKLWIKSQPSLSSFSKYER